jgi:DNA-binding NarL/FixJ family response regulator
MSSKSADPGPIFIGIPEVEPIRVAGLVSIFDLPAQPGRAPMLPVVDSLKELLADSKIGYIVVDLHSSSGGIRTLEEVRSARPDVRLIVIGPEGDDELVMRAILAGARAYLAPSAGPDTLRKAIHEVTSGSIWASRRLLCQLIDRLLIAQTAEPASVIPQLTPREEQVLKLILLARSTREIAGQLGIDQRTVKSHVSRLMRKTGSDNRIQLSVWALSRLFLPK